MIFQYPIKHFQHTLLIDIPLNMVSNCIICFAFLWVLSHPGGFMSFYLWFYCISPAARVTLKQESSFYTLIMCRRFFFLKPWTCTIHALEGRYYEDPRVVGLQWLGHIVAGLWHEQLLVLSCSPDMIFLNLHQQISFFPTEENRANASK